MACGGGGFTYLVNILPRLARRAPDCEFRALVCSDRLAHSIASEPNLTVELLPKRGFAGRLRFAWIEAPRLARQWGADLYFSAGESAPLHAACPTIASLRNPHVFTKLDQGWSRKQRLRLAALRWVARLSIRSCDRVMFVSEDSAEWIGDGLGLPERRRAVIHHGIDREAWSRGVTKTVHPRPYILSVSEVIRHKNYVRLIEAYAALARVRPNVPDLVIVGDGLDPEYEQRMECARAATGALAERIHMVGGVPYAEIPSYYAGADLFVFPSYLETFGHPLLEAMASKVPVVASDLPVFREIAGDAAFYSDPHDPLSLARAMEEALFVPEARNLLVKRGLERLAHFSWDRTATRLLALFDEVGRERAFAPRRTPVGAASATRPLAPAP
ncbi:MAG: glycosyltransferase family 4 protein, partial [Myxococcales bacterium]|nr:glycosyltransferase family 4 protein [Myxococcales bacterium]